VTKQSISPRPHDWAWLADIQAPVDDDFVAAATEQPPEQERPELEHFAE